VVFENALWIRGIALQSMRVVQVSIVARVSICSATKVGDLYRAGGVFEDILAIKTVWRILKVQERSETHNDAESISLSALLTHYDLSSAGEYIDKVRGQQSLAV